MAIEQLIVNEAKLLSTGAVSIIINTNILEENWYYEHQERGLKVEYEEIEYLAVRHWLLFPIGTESAQTLLSRRKKN